VGRAASFVRRLVSLVSRLLSPAPASAEIDGRSGAIGGGTRPTVADLAWLVGPRRSPVAVAAPFLRSFRSVALPLLSIISRAVTIVRRTRSAVRATRLIVGLGASIAGPLVVIVGGRRMSVGRATSIVRAAWSAVRRRASIVARAGSFVALMTVTS
jgi:hypothetical protein